MYRKRVSAHLTCLLKGGGIARTLSYTCQNYLVFSTIAFKIARQALVRSHSWSKIEIIEVRIIEFKEWGVAYVVISALVRLKLHWKFKLGYKVRF
jgi:hypothetical protein